MRFSIGVGLGPLRATQQLGMPRFGSRSSGRRPKPPPPRDPDVIEVVEGLLMFLGTAAGFAALIAWPFYRYEHANNAGTIMVLLAGAAVLFWWAAIRMVKHEDKVMAVVKVERDEEREAARQEYRDRLAAISAEVDARTAARVAAIKEGRD